ncbi:MULTISPECIES: winged helix-turn-helix domain-containing protein [unclassified Bradyrhizobium]|uniref:ATP-binding protein n=1 Tax=unclassified Bradyrhizobium TaxID=2631580 RepID=UPI0024E0CD5A|nr:MULTISPECIES: winged helix-turn-helix domain-containing protein [unclassified Bradyrhizobium]
MIPQDPLSQGDEVSFGSFVVRVSERSLRKGATPVHLPPRALDILLVLLQQAGSVVDKHDLMARVWPDVTVDAGSLRFHIGVLRKVLGDGEAGARFVATVPGKGYSFVCPVSYRMSAEADDRSRAVETNYGLPPRLSRMIGRDDVVEKVCGMLLKDRFVTIVGPGGIGKTTVAIAAAHQTNPQVASAVAFFDLGPLNDPMLVPTAVASTLGLMVQSDDPTPAIISFIHDKSMLLILDSCEHVITSAAALAEHIFQHAPKVRILATSREALRVEGEYVFQLPSLENPPLDVQTVSDVLAFPAARLFMDRVLASGSSFELNDADAPIVGEICRRLDGIALAIEIAASRVIAFGVKGTAALLDDRFRLLGQGRRTALQRHQTLTAALDWSYGLLSDNESLVLRRSAVFVGFFSMRAVIAVVGPDDLSEELAFEAVASLVDKSLIAVASGTSEARYRLLDTTRAYALSKLIDRDDDNGVFQRHAMFYLRWAEQHESVRLTEAGRDGASAYDPHLGNIRAALEWSFLQTEKSIGISLTAATAPLLLESSLVTECRRWTELAMVNLDESSRGTSREVTLQAALGLSLMFSQGNSEEARASLERGLEVAEDLEDLPSQLQLIGRLHLFHYRTGNFREALKYAERSEAVALKMNDQGALAAASSLLGVSHHLMEDLEKARGYLESAVRHIPASKHVDSLRLGLDYRNRAGICLARTLWLLGYADRATELARQVSIEAGKLNHPLTLCIALIWAVSVYLWNGDWENAEQSIERLIDHARNRAIVAYEAAGIGVRGYLAVMRGDHQAGLPMLRYALIETRAHRYELMTTAFKSALAEGLLMAGQAREALDAADDALATVARNGDMFNAAELLRIKGHVFLAETMKDMPRAEGLFIQSLEAAKTCGARAWELRTATSLASLWRSQGRFVSSVELLENVLESRTEGFGCPDFINARKLLSDCARRVAP